ncbi:trypsin Inhibitor like cysteine rich domain protein [Oesophagostomum dentatum]|uniref:Trypsin Inhibitor like cysteine rich domain protein n=1 Tax=Oesophagostomum dentatum TaxID=61180 RepID=A0A0B1SF71_OESDE|nr:trypsin Inhibitor like cysteine rich domain protein [Oesophagostomum dentatum]
MYSACFNGCEPTCKHPDISCLAVCGSGGCVCKFGYLRGENGRCVPKEKC